MASAKTMRKDSIETTINTVTKSREATGSVSTFRDLVTLPSTVRSSQEQPTHQNKEQQLHTVPVSVNKLSVKLNTIAINMGVPRKVLELG